MNEMDTGTYALSYIITLILAIIVSVIFGFIFYTFFNSFVSNAELTLMSFAVGLFILMFPKTMSNELKSFIFAIIFGGIFYEIFIHVMPMIFKSSFVINQSFKNLFGLTLEPIIVYIFMILFFIVVYSIGAFLNKGNLNY